MPWRKVTPMSERAVFVEQAKQANANMSALCRAFGISRKTGYKWLKREREEGAVGLADRSRRPHHSPNRTDAQCEAEVVELRKRYLVWGGRKLRRVLQDAGCVSVPAASTITSILQRNQLIDPHEAQKHKPYQRFERERPNELWQMDFKGYFALSAGGYCHPLTVIDDHSRFLVGLKACAAETIQTVQAQLTDIFQCYGLPEGMLMDNGRVWGFDQHAHHTLLTAWLIRLGIHISHGRPAHPQTQGKDERLNRSLKDEVIQRYALSSLADSQAAFDAWQQVYNYVRPHDALQLDTPAMHYTHSPRPFPITLPPVCYPDHAILRKVDIAGKIYFQGGVFHISAAFRHQPVALFPASEDGQFDVFFCSQIVAKINLRGDNQC